jgi:hypothetical protein
MKLSFEKEQLIYATAATHGVANPQSSLPILGNILISADADGAVTFEASDMEACVRCLRRRGGSGNRRHYGARQMFHSIVKQLPSAGWMSSRVRWPASSAGAINISSHHAERRGFPQLARFAGGNHAEHRAEDVEAYSGKHSLCLTVARPAQGVAGACSISKTTNWFV